MHQVSTHAAAPAATTRFQSSRGERCGAAAGIAVLSMAAVMAAADPEGVAVPSAIAMMVGLGAGDAARGSGTSGIEAAAPERLAGGYLGVTHTHASKVRIDDGGRTSFTTGDIEWEGKPFKSPIYYGVRLIRWASGGRFGALVDFTHAKAISKFEQTTAFSGTLDGKPLPPSAKVGDVFKHLEFSHGHNMLTLNGLMRFGRFPVQPYAGAGAGISLPHTEIGYRNEKGRTYEYQYAGLTGQVLAGLEFRLGKTSMFVEYKFSYSGYDVPLSGVIDGSWLFVDLWRQFSAWAKGERPPGGRLTTPLATHHGIGGVMIRVAPASGG